jgi:hypothetical protein
LGLISLFFVFPDPAPQVLPNAHPVQDFTLGSSGSFSLVFRSFGKGSFTGLGALGSFSFAILYLCFRNKTGEKSIGLYYLIM